MKNDFDASNIAEKQKMQRPQTDMSDCWLVYINYIIHHIHNFCYIYCLDLYQSRDHQSNQEDLYQVPQDGSEWAAVYYWFYGLTLWRPLLPYGYSYKASSARPG